MSPRYQPSLAAGKKPEPANDALSFSADFMSGITNSHQPLQGHTASTPHRLSANFFPVIFGDVRCFYQYKLDSIVEIKPDKPEKTATQGPRHPWRYPLPQGQRASTPAQKAHKARQDAKYLEEFRQAASGISPGGSAGGRQDESRVPKLSKRMRRRLIFVLIEQLKADGVSVGITSDYDTNLITVEPINHKKIPGIWRVAYYDEDEDEDSAHLRRYDVILLLDKKVDVQTFLPQKAKTTSRGPGSDALAALTTLPALLNPFFSHCPNAYTLRKRGQPEPTVTQIGANKYYLLDWSDNNAVKPTPPWQLDNLGGVVAIPGFFRSIRVSIGSSILLNVNTTTSAFYEAGNLFDVLRKFGMQRRWPEIQTFVKGLRLRTTYMTQSQLAKRKAIERHGPTAKPRERIYTATGLPFTDAAPTASAVYFEYFDVSGKPVEVSVAEYWSRSDGHKIQLTSDDLVIKCGKGVYIPAKFLDILPGQPYKPKTDMVAQACRPPLQNYNMIMRDGLWLLGISPLDQFSPVSNFKGLTVTPNMAQVPAVRLASGQLWYHNKTSVMGDLATGRWNLSNLKAFSPAPGIGKEVMVVELVRPRGRNLPQAMYTKFCRDLESSIGKFGLTQWRVFIPIDNRRSISLASEHSQVRDLEMLKSTFDRMKQFGPLAVILLPDNDANLYAQIKRAGDVSVGLQTVCHVLGRVKPKNRQSYWGPKMDPGTLANLVMKINLKLSRKAANQVLPQPFTDKLFTTKTMIIGIDVTHPGPGCAHGSPSVATVVSSVDQHFAQWPASLRVNPRPLADSGLSSERVLYLQEMLQERLADFKAVRGHLPDRLLVYRDGLSEAQFEMCREFELPQIKTAVAKFYAGAKQPPILLVCSVKRHHARFFPVNGACARNEVLDQKLNPRPGVAVFHQITYGENKDFFLVSHETLQGTTRPCHYVVLHNELDNLSITDVANATHHLCYLYGRASRSVSVATPSYYADLVADRARHYVREWYLARDPAVPCDEQAFTDALRVHKNLKNTMFYI